MTEYEQKQLGKTRWNIADQLRGDQGVTMTGSHIYEFYQGELDDLKTANVYTLGICGWIERLR